MTLKRSRKPLSRYTPWKGLSPPFHPTIQHEGMKTKRFQFCSMGRTKRRYPTHVSDISDTDTPNQALCRIHRTHVSDGLFLSDTNIHERQQHVMPNVSDGRDKWGGYCPSRGYMRVIAPFHTDSGRLFTGLEGPEMPVLAPPDDATAPTQYNRCACPRRSQFTVEATVKFRSESITKGV